MNDLMPPPRRDVPDRVGAHVTQLVAEASDRGSTLTRSTAGGPYPRS